MGQGVSIILRFGRFLCFCLFTPLRPLRGSQLSLIFVCLLRWLALFVWFCPFFLFLILEFLRTSQADSLQEADEEEIWQLLSERILEVSFPSFCFLLSTRRIRGIAWQDRDKAFPLFFNLRVFYAFVSLWSLCVLKLFFYSLFFFVLYNFLDRESRGSRGLYFFCLVQFDKKDWRYFLLLSSPKKFLTNFLLNRKQRGKLVLVDQRIFHGCKCETFELRGEYTIANAGECKLFRACYIVNFLCQHYNCG